MESCRGRQGHLFVTATPLVLSKGCGVAVCDPDLCPSRHALCRPSRGPKGKESLLRFRAYYLRWRSINRSAPVAIIGIATRAVKNSQASSLLAELSLYVTYIKTQMQTAHPIADIRVLFISIDSACHYLTSSLFRRSDSLSSAGYRATLQRRSHRSGGCGSRAR